MEVVDRMSAPQHEDVRHLIERLDSAVALGNVDKIARRIKSDLAEIIRANDLSLPEPIIRPRHECYARRLLHRDPDLRYTVVVMTWGVGQATPRIL